MSPQVNNITVYDSEYTFFDDLVTMIYSLFSLDIAISIFTILNINGMPHQNRPSEEILRDIRRPIQDYRAKIVFNVNHTGGRLEIPLIDVQPHINLGRWPQFIEVHHYPSGRAGQGSGLNTRSRIYQRVVGASFMSYYESQVQAIQNKYGRDAKAWPPLMNFARVIRNGFAHDEKINFENPHAVSVVWKKWTYSPADNGKEFLMSTDGLAVGDLIVLFDEIHQDLYPQSKVQCGEQADG